MKDLKINFEDLKRIEIDIEKGQLLIVSRFGREIGEIGKKKDDKQTFFEKPLTLSEIRYELLLFPKRDFPDMMHDYDGPIAVVDYKYGQRVETHMQTNAQKIRRITGLSKLWRYNNRHLHLKEGDVIGIITDPTSHTIYVDFEYSKEYRGDSDVKIFEKKLKDAETTYGVIIAKEFSHILPDGDIINIKDKKDGQEFVGKRDRTTWGIDRIRGLTNFMKKHDAKAGDTIILEIGQGIVTIDIQKVQKY